MLKSHTNQFKITKWRKKIPGMERCMGRWLKTRDKLEKIWDELESRVGVKLEEWSWLKVEKTAYEAEARNVKIHGWLYVVYSPCLKVPTKICFCKMVSCLVFMLYFSDYSWKLLCFLNEDIILCPRTMYILVNMLLFPLFSAGSLATSMCSRIMNLIIPFTLAHGGNLFIPHIPD